MTRDDLKSNRIGGIQRRTKESEKAFFDAADQLIQYYGLPDDANSYHLKINSTNRQKNNMTNRILSKTKEPLKQVTYKQAAYLKSLLKNDYKDLDVDNLNTRQAAYLIDLMINSRSLGDAYEFFLDRQKKKIKNF